MFLALMVANNYLPLSITSDRSFKKFLDVTNARLNPVSRTCLVNNYLLKCGDWIRKYILDKLKGRTACLIIDEMQKKGKSYYNILVSSLGEDDEGRAQTEIFFWDTARLLCGDADSIATLLARTVLFLKDQDIHVTSYSSDNCAVMKKVLPVVVEKTGIQMKRIPCASHAVNLILKDFMEQNCIDRVWVRVRLLVLCDL